MTTPAGCPAITISLTAACLGGATNRSSPNEFPVLASFKEGVAATAANDADVLQFALVTSHPSVRQRLMIAGLVVYLERWGYA